MSSDGVGAESIDLESLVHHREFVEFGTQLEQVQQRFRSTTVEYLAVVKLERVIGLCSRGQIGFVMGSRFGFAVYSKDCVETVMMGKPVIVARDTPLRTVLERAMLRHGDEFKEDVILVDEEQRLLGLIKVEMLAQQQSRLLTEQLEEVQRQHVALRQQNLELFRVNTAARQSQGLYLGLFASHTLGVALLDEKGVIHEQNARLTELLDLEAQLPAGVSLAGWVVEVERRAFLMLLESHANGLAAPANHEFTFNVPGRGARIFRCSMGWIKETGQICACFDDLTEQRALEHNLLRREKQTLLDTLVGGIAHELNNKLAPIMGFAELLRTESSGETSEYTGHIIKSVHEAARIIRQLLELSKPNLQSAQPLDLRTVAEETLALLKFQLREAGCKVQKLLPAGPVKVIGDIGQLKQVALNLAINALHAMEHTKNPVLTVQVRGVGQAAELVVTDNGCGIKAENLNRIFDPFFTTKGPERGTGLGLSVCYSIVRQYSGDIKVESELGVGTCFTVSLRHEPSATLTSEVDKPLAAMPPISTPHSSRVLIVEDEIVLRRLLQEILCTRLGCRVELANNGLEALEALEHGRFAMVLSDIRMPIMSGTELYERMCTLHPELARRFIFITGHASERKLQGEISKWNVPVIAKPFTFSRLAEVCRPILEEAESLRDCA